jgi:hypothetical protein
MDLHSAFCVLSPSCEIGLLVFFCLAQMVVIAVVMAVIVQIGRHVGNAVAGLVWHHAW